MNPVAVPYPHDFLPLALVLDELFEILSSQCSEWQLSVFNILSINLNCII